MIRNIAVFGSLFSLSASAVAQTSVPIALPAGQIVAQVKQSSYARVHLDQAMASGTPLSTVASQATAGSAAFTNGLAGMNLGSATAGTTPLSNIAAQAAHIYAATGDTPFASISSTDLSKSLITVTGGTPRLLGARASNELDLKDAGAVEDGVTDDTAALQQMFAIAQNRLNLGLPVGLRLPPGRTVISQALSLTVPANGHLSIRGLPHASEIATSFVGPVIQITTGNGPSTTGTLISLSGLGATKLGGTAAGGDAFEILGGNPIPEVKIKDLRCDVPYGGAAQWGGTTTPWHSCVHLQNVVRSDIDGIISQNNGAHTGDPNQGIGLWMDATVGLYSIDNHVTHLQVVDGFAGVMATGHIEGLALGQSTLLANAYNLYAPGRTYPNKDSGSQFLLWATVSHTHLDSFLRGIYVVNGGSIKSDHNLYYNAGWSADGTPTNVIAPPSTAWLPIDTAERNPNGAFNKFTFSGFDCVNCDWPVVAGDEIAGNNAPYADAIRLPKLLFDSSAAGDASGSGTITGNTLHNFQGAGMVIDAGSFQDVVSSNHCDNVSPCVSSAEPTTLSLGNLIGGSVEDIGYQNGTSYLHGPLWAANGNVTSTIDGTLTASGLISKHNVQAGPSSSYILSDATGAGAGYMINGTNGIINIGTFTIGGQAGLAMDYLTVNKGVTGPGAFSVDSAGNTSSLNTIAQNISATGGIYLPQVGANQPLLQTDAVTGEMHIRANKGTTGLAIDGPVVVNGFTGLGSFATASLPAACTPGQIALANDGRKPGEAAHTGTGVPVMCANTTQGSSATAWYAMPIALVTN